MPHSLLAGQRFAGRFAHAPMPKKLFSTHARRPPDNESLSGRQKVDMIGHAADALRSSTEARHGPSQILVKARAPFRRDDSFAILRRKHQMVMEAQIGGSHAAFP